MIVQAKPKTGRPNKTKKTMHGQSIVCDQLDVDAMKARAAKWQQVHSSQLVLLHSGRQLVDNSMLGSICQQSVIHVVLKPTARIHCRIQPGQDAAWPVGWLGQVVAGWNL